MWARFREVPKVSPQCGQGFGKRRKCPRNVGKVSRNSESLPAVWGRFREVPKVSPQCGQGFGKRRKCPRGAGILIINELRITVK